MAIAVWEDRVFTLQTRNMTYAFCVDQNGLLRHLYWGGRIGRVEDFLRDADAAPVKKQRYDALAEEFSAFGGMRNRETALKVAFSDRTRDFRYVIAGHRVDGTRFAYRCATRRTRWRLCFGTACTRRRTSWSVGWNSATPGRRRSAWTGSTPPNSPCPARVTG